MYKIKDKHSQNFKQLPQDSSEHHLFLMEGATKLYCIVLIHFKNENTGVRVSDRLDVPVAMGRDGTNDPTILDASSDWLFDKKTFDCLLHPRVSRNVIPQSPLIAEFQFHAPP
jgi:hypothetical protein